VKPGSRTEAATSLRVSISDRIVAVLSWLAFATPILAASPSPTMAPGGDPRSSGQGPGLVGDPLYALLVVVAIGVGALVVTLAYVRLTGPRPRG
jgi:hypothetical protein